MFRASRPYDDPYKDLLPPIRLSPRLLDYDLEDEEHDLLPLFHGLPDEDALGFMQVYEDITRRFPLKGLTRDEVNMRLFIYTLKDRARTWLLNLKPDSLTTWDEVRSRFMGAYYGPYVEVSQRSHSPSYGIHLPPPSNPDSDRCMNAPLRFDEITIIDVVEPFVEDVCTEEKDDSKDEVVEHVPFVDILILDVPSVDMCSEGDVEVLDESVGPLVVFGEFVDGSVGVLPFASPGVVEELSIISLCEDIVDVESFVEDVVEEATIKEVHINDEAIAEKIVEKPQVSIVLHKALKPYLPPIPRYLKIPKEDLIAFPLSVFPSIGAPCEDFIVEEPTTEESKFVEHLVLPPDSLLFLEEEVVEEVMKVEHGSPLLCMDFTSLDSESGETMAPKREEYADPFYDDILLVVDLSRFRPPKKVTLVVPFVFMLVYRAHLGDDLRPFLLLENTKSWHDRHLFLDPG
jgi:hypothetical protein